MDHYSFRLANRLVGNKDADAAFEVIFNGPSVTFHADTLIALTGTALAHRWVQMIVYSFRFASFRFASLRFASFCFVSFRFVSLRFVSFRSIHSHSFSPRGAKCDPKLDGVAIPMWQSLVAKQGQTLQFHVDAAAGFRSYLAIAGMTPVFSSVFLSCLLAFFLSFLLSPV
jgi:allophanate hydrolase subunit 2